MEKNKLIPRLLFLFGGLLFLCAACSNGLETVETKDDYGYPIKYSRSKKDYAKQGLYVKKYPDGTVYEEAHYKDDTLDGQRKLYFESGKVQIVENYVAGAFDGLFQQYYESGELQMEGAYVNNIASGDWKKFYRNGQASEIVSMRNNEENGPFIEYYENGNKKTEGNYLDGDNEDGLLQMYNEAGELIKKMNCEKGVCRTSWTKEGTSNETNH